MPESATNDCEPVGQVDELRGPFGGDGDGGQPAGGGGRERLHESPPEWRPAPQSGGGVVFERIGGRGAEVLRPASARCERLREM